MKYLFCGFLLCMLAGCKNDTACSDWEHPEPYWRVFRNGTYHEGLAGTYGYQLLGDLWITGSHADGHVFSVFIYGLSVPQIGFYPWHDGSGYTAAADGKGYMLYLAGRRYPEYAPETWWRRCVATGPENQASPGGITIRRVQAIHGTMYIEGTLTARLWDGHGQCNPEADSDVRIDFLLAPKR